MTTPEFKDEPLNKFVSNDEALWRKTFDALWSDNAFIAKNFEKKSFYNFECTTEKQKKLVEILRNRPVDDNVGIWFAGKAGTGKTHLMTALMNSLAWLWLYQYPTLSGRFKFYNYADLCGVLRDDPNNFDKFHKIRSPRF